MNHPHPAETFGDFLKFLRKRARLTQRDIAAAVGYTEAHLSRLENNDRLPDLTTVAALFIPALDLKDDPAASERLLKLAAQARGGRAPQEVTREAEQEAGALEEIPAPLLRHVDRSALVSRIVAALKSDRCVALCGLAGMGKSALAATVARAQLPGTVFWHTFTEGVTTSPEAILRQLAHFLLAQEMEQVKPLVEPRRDAAPMPVDQQLTLIRSALADYSALLCFEDAHLIVDNEASLSLLRHLMTTTDASFLLTSRVELPLPMTHVNVGGLEADEARALVQRLGLDLEPGAQTSLLSKTDRSPMLLKLAAGQLLEHGADVRPFLEHLETQPQVSSYLLNSILHDLPPAARWLASLLSVFRQPMDLYDETLVAMIVKSDLPGGLVETIFQLQNRYLIENARHVILHPLIRDFLYASLATDAPRKKRLHHLAAEWSEAAAGDIVEAAFHWMRAGDLEQASEVISDQSEALFNRGQASAAVQVVDEALERAARKRGETTSLRRRLLTARGDLLRGTVRAADAEASYREALSLAQGQPTVRAGIARNLVQSLLQRGQIAEALRLCQSATADLSPSDTVLRARLAAIEARAHLVLSKYEDAERVASEAIALADQFAEALPSVADDVYARCERTLGWVNYTRHPEGDESLVHYRRALECARRAGLRVNECAILSNTATALMERHELDAAAQAYEDALKGYEAIGDLYGAASILHNLGVLMGAREDNQAALRYFEQASEIERRVGDREGLLSSESARASLLLSMDRLSEARAVMDRAMFDGKDSTDLWTMGSCLCILSEVLVLQGEFENARASAQRVLAMPGIENNARIRSWAQSDLALIQIAAGEFDAAQTTMAEPPMEDLGFELTTRWKLVQSAAALAVGDADRAHCLAREVFEESSQKELKQLRHTAELMMAVPPVPATELPRCILISD